MASDLTQKEKIDFVTRLLAMVDSKRSTEATDEILAVENFGDQLRILTQLASHLNKTDLRLRFQLSLMLLIHHLVSNRDHLLINNLALELVDVLTLAKHLVVDFPLVSQIDRRTAQMNYNRALAHARALDRAINLARKRDHNARLILTLVRARAYALDSAFTLAFGREMDRDFDIIHIVIEGISFLIAIDYVPQNIQEHINQAYYQLITKIYKESLI